LLFSRRGAEAQSEHNQQETSSPKNALLLQKTPRLCASARDHSAYAIAQQLHVQLPIPKNVCAIQDNPKNPYELLFSRRAAEAQSEHNQQETSSPKNALSSQKALRLSASARDHSAYAS